MQGGKFIILGALALLLASLFLVSGASVERGKEIYESYCLVCHGENGGGQKDKGVDFSDPNFWAKESDEEVEEVIENGRGQMPAWKGTLSSDDIHSVVMYIKTFAKQTPSVSETHPETAEEAKETPHKEVKAKKQPGFEIVMVVIAGITALLVFRRI